MLASHDWFRFFFLEVERVVRYIYFLAILHHLEEKILLSCGLYYTRAKSIRRLTYEEGKERHLSSFILLKTTHFVYHSKRISNNGVIVRLLQQNRFLQNALDD